jgi:thiol-disulfide isomerase/thioredoxin
MRAFASATSALFLPALLLAGCGKQASDGNMMAPNASMADNVSVAPVAPELNVYREEKGEAAPTAEFVGPGGTNAHLAAFAGKPFLLYLWGTGFQQSVDMMPSLDALAAEGNLPVVALNIEGRSSEDLPDVVTPFLQAHNFKALKDYRDPKQAMLAALHGPTIPNAILYDSTGHQVLRIIGSADFTSREVRALLAEAK